MTSRELIEKAFLPTPDSPYSLGTAIAARSGSGKTTLIRGLVMPTVKWKEWKNVRFVYISMKGDTAFPEGEFHGDVGEAIQSIAKNKFTTFAPQEMGDAEGEIDILIEEVFHMARANAGKKERPLFVIIVDDANVLKGFNSTGRPSSSVMKLAVAGRSMGIRPVFIVHRAANLPRLLNGQLSSLIVMNMGEMDSEYFRKIFGMDLDAITEGLGDFRWAFVDLIEEDFTKFAPIKPL